MLLKYLLLSQNNNFIKSSNELSTFYSKNRKKLNSYVFAGNTESQLADLLMSSIIADVTENKISVITTGFLCSELTFSNRLPKYLHNQGLILQN